MVERQLARMLVPDGLSQVMYPFHVEQRIRAEDVVYSPEEPLCVFGRRRYEPRFVKESQIRLLGCT
jgi:hypothetical protein